MKNIISKIINVICVAIIIFAIFILVMVVMGNARGDRTVFGYSAFHVLTGSMEPEIPTGSFVIARTIDPADIEVGDVISFYSRDPQLYGQVNTHRVAAINTQIDGSLGFTTKGDANMLADESIVQEADIIGRVIFISTLLGKLVRLLQNPLVFVPVILIPLFVIFVINLKNTVAAAKKLSREEEEQALREALAEVRRKQEELEQLKAANAAEAEGDDNK